MIAGPIVRYADIEEQLTNRKCTADKFVSGIKFFSVGLAKKAILANSLALTADKIFALSAEQRTISVAWCGYSIRFSCILILADTVTWQLDWEKCLDLNFLKTLITRLYPVL